MSAALLVEVEFDLVCPWCLIGLRQLERALAMLRAAAPEVPVALHWKGVQLLPGVPDGGYHFMDFYRQRLGSDAAIARRQAQVRAAAASAGAVIDYGAITVMPNTADAHRLLELAGATLGAEGHLGLLERLLRAYFERGEDLGDAAVLRAHGLACGLAPAALARLFKGAGTPYAGQSSGQGVPLFTMNGRVGVAGAQPAAVLLRSMLRALGVDAGAVA
ncbi:MAG: DsbA family protein [Pseudomonadota bacterium]